MTDGWKKGNSFPFCERKLFRGVPSFVSCGWTHFPGRCPPISKMTDGWKKCNSWFLPKNNCSCAPAVPLPTGCIQVNQVFRRQGRRSDGRGARGLSAVGFSEETFSTMQGGVVVCPVSLTSGTRWIMVVFVFVFAFVFYFWICICVCIQLPLRSVRSVLRGARGPGHGRGCTTCDGKPSFLFFRLTFLFF